MTILNLQNQQGWILGDVDWQCLFRIIAWCLWNNRFFFSFFKVLRVIVKLSKCRIAGQDNMSQPTGARQMFHQVSFSFLFYLMIESFLVQMVPS